jgi:hypothetical protein
MSSTAREGGKDRNIHARNLERVEGLQAGYLSLTSAKADGHVWNTQKEALNVVLEQLESVPGKQFRTRGERVEREGRKRTARSSPHPSHCEWRCSSSAR